MDALKTHPTATAVVFLIAGYIGSFVFRLIQHRKKFKNLVGFSSLEGQCRSVTSSTNTSPVFSHTFFEYHTACHDIYTLIITKMSVWH